MICKISSCVTTIFFCSVRKLYMAIISTFFAEVYPHLSAELSCRSICYSTPARLLLSTANHTLVHAHQPDTCAVDHKVLRTWRCGRICCSRLLFLHPEDRQCTTAAAIKRSTLLLAIADHSAVTYRSGDAAVDREGVLPTTRSSSYCSYGHS